METEEVIKLVDNLYKVSEFKFDTTTLYNVLYTQYFDGADNIVSELSLVYCAMYLTHT